MLKRRRNHGHRGAEIFQCYFDPGRNAFIAVLSDNGVRNGKECQLSEADLVHVENAVRKELGV